MFRKNSIFTALALSVIVLSFASAATAKPTEYDLVIRHLKEKYKAKKVGVPFMSLARLVVNVVRPAGVKGFKLTLFNGLEFSRETLDSEMQAAMRASFGPEWTPILRVRSREGQQVYMYMRESGKDVKINLVSIDKQDAAVIRATFDPDKLVEFMNNPKIFGISIGDDKPKEDKPAEHESKPAAELPDPRK